MKNTRKILVALLVVMSLLVGMFVVTASAATPEKLYLTPSANWKQSNARFAAYFFGDSGNTWVSMTDPDGDGVYEVTVPAGYPNVIFCRMNPGTTTNSFGENIKWNQTADLVIPTSGPNHYTVKEGTWDSGGGTWSTFGSNCAHTNLGPAATCTTPQKCLTCGDPVVSELGHTYNTAHLCTRCNTQATFTVAGTGAHLNGEWAPGNTANDMTYADGVYTKVYTNVAIGSYELKCVRDHAWGTEYPSANKAYTVTAEGSTVTVTLKGTTVDVKVESASSEPVADIYTVSGTICPDGQWNLDDDRMTLGEDGIYTITYTNVKKGGYSFKVFKNLSWDNGYSDGNENYDCYIMNEGSTVVISFDPETSKVSHAVYYNDQPVVLYIVAGHSGLCGSEWAHTDDNNVMTLVDGKYQIVYTGVAAGSYGLKVVKDGSWDTAWGDPSNTAAGNVGNYMVNVAEANSTVTITFDPATNEITYTAEVPHVNSLAVGDTNKIVIGDSAVDNGFGYLVESVVFTADEKAHYKFAGEGLTILVYDLQMNNLCGFTGEADLEAGMYIICIAANTTGTKGEFNVAVTKTEIAPPAPQYNWWASDSSLYTVEGNNIKYNGAGNTYACVGCDVTTLAAGKNTFTITITNNGAATVKVRVDIQATVQVGNHKVVNTGAVGGDAWTDSNWGGSYVHVAPGESVTLVVSYDENTERGAVKDLIIFADSARGDDATYSADITVSDMAFSYVSDEPDHQNALTVGDTNKIVVSGNFLNDYGLPVEWVPFVAEDNGFYSFVGDKGALAFIFTSEGALVSATGAANLEAGTYLVCLGNGAVGEFNVAVTKSAWVNALVVGENKLLITDALDNGAGYYIVWVPFEVTEKANYTFGGEGVLALVYDAAGQAVAGTELDVGTYNICVAFLTPATTGVATVKVEKTPIGDAPVVEDPALALGDNKVVIDGTQTNLTGNAIAWYTFTPETAGTYTFACSDLTVYILTAKNMGDINAYVGAGGVAELEAGTKYYILVGKDGIEGEFTVNVSVGGEVAEKNSVALGDFKYNLNQALKDGKAEFLSFTAEKSGWYTFNVGKTFKFYVWHQHPDITYAELAALGNTIPFVWNMDYTTGEFTDSLTVYLEAGTYWVGFNFDNAAVGEYDMSVSYSETDPNPAPTPEVKPDAQPEEELTLVQRILKMITDFFANIVNWFKNLLPANKE